MDLQRLDSQIQALQAVILTILTDLACTDREAARRIVSRIPRFSPDGTTPFGQRFALVDDALDDLLHELRAKIDEYHTGVDGDG